MSYGQLNKTQLGVLAPLVIGKIIHDLGAGDLGLALKLLRLGAAKIIAIDKEYNRKIFNGVPPEIELRHQFFQDMHDEIDIAFVSWPSNYNNGLLNVLMQTKIILYLGKNTDGSACGTPSLFRYLTTRKIQIHVCSRHNTLICYTDHLDEPRKKLLQEEDAAINSHIDQEPVTYHTRILFLDDNPARHDIMDARYPLDEIIHVYDIDEYREALERYDHFDMISLDHDLNDFEHRSYMGDCDLTGRDACGYLMRYLHKAPEVIHIHSSNGDGARDMMAFLDSRGVSNRWIMFDDNPHTHELPYG
jgi:CheY-like chemotaxis protein